MWLEGGLERGLDQAVPMTIMFLGTREIEWLSFSSTTPSIILMSSKIVGNIAHKVIHHRVTERAITAQEKPMYAEIFYLHDIIGKATTSRGQKLVLRVFLNNPKFSNLDPVSSPCIVLRKSQSSASN